MTSPSFTRMATVTASTKRPPAISAGKRGLPATNIVSLNCLPIDPIEPEVRARLGNKAPETGWQTVVQGSLDILAGDRLVVGATEYEIKAVEPWAWHPDSSTFHLLVLELPA